MRFLKSIGIIIVIGCCSFLILIPLSFLGMSDDVITGLSALLGIIFGGIGVLIGTMYYYGWWDKNDRS